MVSLLQAFPDIPERALRHDEHLDDALDGVGHGMGLFGALRVRLEDDVVSLREAHDEDEVDGDEPQQVRGHHSVDHDDEGSGRLEAPAEEQEVGSGQEHDHDGQAVLGGERAGQSERNGDDAQSARRQEHDPGGTQRQSLQH